jgi:hypothetical protein
MRLHKVSLITIEMNEFTRVKTNNRLVQSLYLGLGVVADAIDSYREFDSCTFLDKWDEGLRGYLEDPALLQAHIRDGQAIIRQNYSITAIAQQWRDLFMRVAGHPPGPSGFSEECVNFVPPPTYACQWIVETGQPARRLEFLELPAFFTNNIIEAV